MHKNTKQHFDMPEIVVRAADEERLGDLATAAMARLPEVARRLLSEIERAKIAPANTDLSRTVQMGSTVAFRLDDGKLQRVTLVYPGAADISAGRVSILTPIGTALLGLSEGQSIRWSTRDGRPQRLTVLSVEQQERSE